MPDADDLEDPPDDPPPAEADEGEARPDPPEAGVEHPFREPKPEIAEEVAEETAGFLGLMGHFYRGEVGRATSWRQRLDRTTNWSIVILATVLTFTFSSRENPHFLILGGVMAVTIFMAIEARRYRMYDVWRSRVRMIEENVLAHAIHPEGVVHPEWRKLVARDLREPEIKIPFLEALSHRLRRVYLPILLVLVGSWFLRIGIFVPLGTTALEAATVGRVPGAVVIATVAGFTAAVLVLAVWPMRRLAKGELQEPEAYEGEWKED